MPSPQPKKAKTAPAYKKTEERVTLPGRKRASVVYVGSRGAKYIKMKGAFVTLKMAEKMVQKMVQKMVKKGGADDLF